MRKIIIFIIVISGLFYGLGNLEPVSAQACQCVEWRNEPVYRDSPEMCPYPYEHIVCKPVGWYDQAVCVANSCGRTCGPGSYVCNRPTGCCETGTPPPSSFMAGTIVSTPLGGKKIEDLKVGDRVISFTGNTIVESIVSKTHKVRRDYYFDLVADGYRVKVTAKHPFYMGNDEFKTAEELQVGDNVYILEKQSLVKKRVTSKTKVNQIADVYNLTVDGTNTYFAGGFAVHNKGDFECNNRKVDCPTGYTRTNTPLYTECKAEHGGTAAWCSGIGTAQAVTECCDNTHIDEEGNEVCNHGNDRITTYTCEPNNLPCPSGFSVSCNPSGTQATVNWDDLSGASGYVLRVNKDPQAEWMGAGDQWQEPVSSSQVLNITPSSNYVYDVQGKKPNEAYPYSGARCPFSSFNCTPAPVNGVCSGTHYSCIAGTSANNVSGATTWTWNCNGSNGGTKASCSENKPIVAWWQVKDGSVHSGSDIFSDIPGACAGGCTPSLLTGVSGLASYLGTLGVGGGSLSQDGTDWQAETVYTGTRTGFGYFKRLLSDDPAGIGVWDGGLPDQSGVSLAESGVTTDGTWNIGAGEKLVFLADGEVTIAGNIDVAPGGFLAVIASGNINIHPSVTKVEGVFISDGVIGTGISNQQLTGEGIFTGWEGINLQRDLNDDSQTPAERFVYRPDLQLNAYRYLLWLGINWREVAP